MGFLRFIMLLALTVWLGALIFFSVVAQTAFSVLPTRHLAGLVVRGGLLKLHWMGFGCGVAFLVSSLAYNRGALGRARAFAVSHILIVAMLALTAISQFQIIPRMETLRIAAGEIDSLGAADPSRLEFESLHAWSTRVEGAVLILGVVLLYAASRNLAGRRP